MGSGVFVGRTLERGGEPDGIGGSVEFRTDVFDAESIETLIERLQRVLVAVIADTGAAVVVGDVLDAGEHARLDEIGNRAVLTRPAPTPVSIRCCSPRKWRARPTRWRCPSKAAPMTYRELDEAATRLAHLLAGQGVGPGEFVALLFSRSAQAIVAMVRGSRPGRPICRSTRRCQRPDRAHA